MGGRLILPSSKAGTLGVLRIVLAGLLMPWQLGRVEISLVYTAFAMHHLEGDSELNVCKACKVIFGSSGVVVFSKNFKKRDGLRRVRRK